MMNLIVYMEEKGLSSEQAQMIFRCFACSRSRNAGKHWPGNDHQEIGNQEKKIWDNQRDCWNTRVSD